VQIFIGNLPGDATLRELDEFLGGLKLSANTQVCRGVNAHAENYHYFLAQVEDPQQADALIGRLNGKLFLGRPIEARRFVKRKCREPWRGQERRINPADQSPGP
jgi:hypothetical protein